jgi:hypothetical protein
MVSVITTKKENKTCFSSSLRIDKNIVTIVTFPRVIRLFKRLSGDDPGDDVVTTVTMFLAVLGHSMGEVVATRDLLSRSSSMPPTVDGHAEWPHHAAHG